VTFVYESLFNDIRGGFDTSGTYGPSKNEFTGNPQTRGGVFAVALPPGEYEFNAWSIDNGTGAYIEPKNPIKLKFLVESNKVKYLGNLNMQLSTGENMFGINIITGGNPTIHNFSSRDIVIAKNKFPFLANKNIEVSILGE